MNTLLAATRAVHFASTLLVFGGIAFGLLVARPALQHAVEGRSAWRAIAPRLRVMLLSSLAVSIVSLVFWLGLELPLMSGERFEDALTGPTLGIVVTQTWFGRVAMARVAIALILGGWLTLGRPTSVHAGSLAIAVAYVVLPALAGHAAGGQGIERYVRVGADMLHLAAAGAWVGALPGLAIVLKAARGESAIDLAARVARRFSTLGTISVATLVVTGTVNSLYLVRGLDALVDTEYGRLLLAKVALVTTMLALAAVNRWALSPRVVAGESAALGALARNTALEIAGGVAVIAIVGFLGITVPAMHPAHHGLHSGTSGAIISYSTGFMRGIEESLWPNPTSSTNPFRKASTTISRHSSDPTPFLRTAWISRCSMAFLPRSSADRS